MDVAAPECGERCHHVERRLLRVEAGGRADHLRSRGNPEHTARFSASCFRGGRNRDVDRRRDRPDTFRRGDLEPNRLGRGHRPGREEVVRDPSQSPLNCLEASTDGPRLEFMERETVEGVNDGAHPDGPRGEPTESSSLRAVRVNQIELPASEVRAELAHGSNVHPWVDASSRREVRYDDDRELGRLSAADERAALRGKDGCGVAIRVEGERAAQRDAARTRSELRDDLGNSHTARGAPEARGRAPFRDGSDAHVAATTASVTAQISSSDMCG